MCQLVKDGKLSKLKVGMLSMMCEDLSLDVPAKPVKRKAPYLRLLEDVVASPLSSLLPSLVSFLLNFHLTV